MKTLLTILCMVAVVSVALAEKPVQPADDAVTRVECEFENVTYDWNFAESIQGFTKSSCDDGGETVWEYGVIDTYPDLVWGTVIGGQYPNDAGESLVSPSFVVDDSAFLVEILHGYWIENSFDGCNLSVNGITVDPIGGYPEDEISESDVYYAWCVDGEPGFTGDSGGEPIVSCFDLSAFLGQEVQLSFDFGSDSTVQNWGWYIAYVRVGGDVVANDATTWSAVKGTYR